MSIHGRPVIAFIPARLASTRFPRKVLAAETGAPLVQHVHMAASRAVTLDALYIATESHEVAEVVAGFGGRPLLTSLEHPNGASRIAEACELLDLGADVIVLNVQGDEPEMDAASIDAAALALAESDAPMATVASPFFSDEDPRDPNLVKVVLNRRSEALYFSRAMIPYDRDGVGRRPPLKHVGLYAYRREFLRIYVSLEPTILERTETLEQLRVLENGYAIAVTVRECRSRGIDTAAQYTEFVERWKSRPGGMNG